MSTAGWLAAGTLTGEDWQVVGGLAICVVAIAAAVLGARDNEAKTGEPLPGLTRLDGQHQSDRSSPAPQVDCAALTAETAASGFPPGEHRGGGDRDGVDRRQFDEIVAGLAADYPSVAGTAIRRWPRRALVIGVLVVTPAWGLLSAAMVVRAAGGRGPPDIIGYVGQDTVGSGDGAQ